MLDRDKVRLFWDARARLYQQVPFESIANLEHSPENLSLKIQHETEKVFSWLGAVKGKCVVDLGAGVGQWAFRFVERGAAKVTAVEFSAELAELGVEEARRRGVENVEFVVSPAESFRTRDLFDVVFSSGLCVYLDDQQFNAVVHQMPHLISPGGVLLLRDGIGRAVRHEIDDRFSEHLQSNYSATYRTREMYLEALSDCGLELLRDEDMFPEGHPLNKYPETRLHLFLFRGVA